MFCCGDAGLHLGAGYRSDPAEGRAASRIISPTRVTRCTRGDVFAELPELVVSFWQMSGCRGLVSGLQGEDACPRLGPASEHRTLNHRGAAGSILGLLQTNNHNFPRISAAMLKILKPCRKLNRVCDLRLLPTIKGWI